MMTGHSILAPSSASVWVECPGSIAMTQGLEQDPTDDTREGEAVHWLSESALLNGSFTLDVANAGIVAPNGVIITEDMLDAATVYVDDVMDDMVEYQTHVEEKVVMPEIHSECWGTPDAWRFNPRSLTLKIWDLKYGHGSVSPRENWQMIAYALGILKKINRNGNPLDEHHIKVEFRIVQPRCYDGEGPVKIWTIPATELRGHINRLNDAAHLAMKGDAKISAGMHCKYCTARHLCPALLRTSANAADYAGQAVHRVMPPEALAYEISVLRRAESLIKFRKEALEEEAMARITGGMMVPGLTARSGKSRSKWTKPNKEVIAMCGMMGVDVKKAEEPLTPAQTIAEFKKLGVDPEVISSYHGRKSTSLKLELDDGSRAKQIFSKEKL